MLPAMAVGASGDFNDFAKIADYFSSSRLTDVSLAGVC